MNLLLRSGIADLWVTPERTQLATFTPAPWHGPNQHVTNLWRTGRSGVSRFIIGRTTSSSQLFSWALLWTYVSFSLQNPLLVGNHPPGRSCGGVWELEMNRGHPARLLLFGGAKAGTFKPRPSAISFVKPKFLFPDAPWDCHSLH